MRLLKTSGLSFLIFLSATPSWAFDCSSDPVGCFIIWALGSMGKAGEAKYQAERVKCLDQAEALGYKRKAREDLCPQSTYNSAGLPSQDWFGKFSIEPVETFYENQCKKNLRDIYYQYDITFYYQQEHVFKDMLDASYYCKKELHDVAIEIVTASVNAPSEYTTPEERVQGVEDFHKNTREHYALPQLAYDGCIAQGNTVSACEAVREQTKATNRDYISANAAITGARRTCATIEQYMIRMSITEEGFVWIPSSDEIDATVKENCDKHIEDYISGNVPELSYDSSNY